MPNLSITQIREKLLQEQARNDKVRELAQEAVAEVITMISNLTEEDYAIASENNIQLDFLKNLDRTRLLEDTEYLAKAKAMAEASVNKLTDKLEEVLACIEQR